MDLFIFPMPFFGRFLNTTEIWLSLVESNHRSGYQKPVYYRYTKGQLKEVGDIIPKISLSVIMPLRLVKQIWYNTVKHAANAAIVGG